MHALSPLRPQHGDNFIKTDAGSVVAAAVVAGARVCGPSILQVITVMTTKLYN